MWMGPPEIVYPRLTLAQKASGLLRLLCAVAMTLLGVLLFVTLKAAERIGLTPAPRLGLSRLWAHLMLACFGLTVEQRGTPNTSGGAIVANHASWLDIMVLRTGPFVTFMAKEEVATWPGIGIIARVNGTMFIARRAAEAKRQQIEMRERIGRGELLCFFPEGTSTDGRRVLAFKSALFAVFFDDALRDTLKVQPVSIAYRPPAGQPEGFYGWWGEMGMESNMLDLVARSRGGRVVLTWHPPLAPNETAGRKDMAVRAEAAVREGLAAAGVPLDPTEYV